MKKTGEDRRARITKLAIKESLVELMQVHPISKISVTMLCASAEINRSTFYSHYADPYDLLNAIQQEVITDIKNHITSIRFMEQLESTVPVIVQVLEYAKARAALFRVLLSGNGDSSFQNELMYLAQEKTIDELREDKRLDESVTKYVELFATSGVLSIIHKWLTDNCQDETTKLARVINTLLSYGVHGLYQ